MKGARTRDTVAVRDQFGEFTIAIKQPFRLCTPVSKNDEPILDPRSHLMCYKARPRGPRPPEIAWIGNQFGSDVVDVRHVRELCVPSLKFLPTQPTPTPTPTPTATETRTPEPSPTPTPSCGGLTIRGFRVCGGPCPGEEQCVFDPAGGDCRCAQPFETCAEVPPGTIIPGGQCLGLCPNETQVCVPGPGACECTFN